LTLTATWPTGGRKDSLYWYDAAGNKVGAGPSFKTPTLTASTTYYVQADVKKYYVGPIDDQQIGTAYAIGPNNYALIFDALADIMIDSVTVNPRSAGTVEITIEDASGNVVGANSVYVPVGGGNDYQVPVKVKVPTGTDYYMWAYNSTMNLSYNSGSGIYPYSSGDVDITASSIGSSYWFYFYNWVIADTAACPSQKVAVRATVGTGGKPTASATITNRCTNDSTSFRDASSTTSGTIASVSIDFGDGKTASMAAGQTAKHKYAAAGTYKVVVTAVGSGGCSDDSTYSVTINAAPKARLVAKSNTACNGATLTFYDSTVFTGGFTRSWNYAVTNTTANEYEYKFAGAGSYKLTLKSTANGCTDSASVAVTINPTPVAKFGIDSLCGGPVAFRDSSTTSAGTITSWKYTFGDGNTSTKANTRNTYATNGNYNATLVVTNSFGCTSTNLALKVVKVLPAVQADIVYKINGSQVDFKSMDSVSGTYAWDFGDLNNASGSKTTHTYANKGAFKVKLTVTNANGCMQEDTQTVVITGLEDNASAPFGLNAYPNPFNDRTVITYNLATSEVVSLQVSDVLGRVIANLQNGMQTSGTHNVEFNTPATEKAGVYFVRLVVGDKAVTKEIIRVK
jgi:PKD repeat protein